MYRRRPPIIFFNALLLATSLFLLSSCGTGNEPEGTYTEQTAAEEQEVISELEWVVGANPEADAEAAAKNNEYRFWGINLRKGTLIPGIDENVDANHRENARIQSGMGDMIYSERHKELRNEFMAYAESYNKWLYECMQTRCTD